MVGWNGQGARRTACIEQVSRKGGRKEAGEAFARGGQGKEDTRTEKATRKTQQSKQQSQQGLPKLQNLAGLAITPFTPTPYARFRLTILQKWRL
jgi:hypothetical protein